MWWWTVQGTFCHPTTERLVIGILEQQTDSHRGTARSCKCQTGLCGQSLKTTCGSYLKGSVWFPVNLLQGCRERTDKFNPNPKEWSAFRSTDYGYSRMHVVNGTHLYLEQVSDDQVSTHRGECAHNHSKKWTDSTLRAKNNDKEFSVCFQYGKVIDSIWVVKEKHGFSAWVWRLCL